VFAFCPMWGRNEEVEVEKGGQSKRRRILEWVPEWQLGTQNNGIEEKLEAPEGETKGGSHPISECSIQGGGFHTTSGIHPKKVSEKRENGPSKSRKAGEGKVRAGPMRKKGLLKTPV